VAVLQHTVSNYVCWRLGGRDVAVVIVPSGGDMVVSRGKKYAHFYLLIFSVYVFSVYFLSSAPISGKFRACFRKQFIRER